MSARHLVVVGDLLLDRDVDGAADRLAPDAPVAVVEERGVTTRPGGAGLAAALAARDGHEVTLVSAVGEGPAGRDARALLEAADVRLVDLGLDGDTPEKVRICAGQRPLLRLDRGVGGAGPGPAPSEACEALDAADGVLVSDYGRGVAADEELRGALCRAAGRIPVVWDPHPRGPAPVAGCWLVTPNRAEAERLLPDVEAKGMASGACRARKLAADFRARAVVVTLGAKGAVLVEGGGRPLVIPVAPADGGDPCGAGDRFASRAIGRLAAGASATYAVVDAVAAASAFVAAGGARCAGIASLSPSLTPPPAAIRPPPRDAVERVRQVRAGGGTVVATGGCFDLLHAGHVAMLQAARSLGDCLVVCLNSDASVRRLKGPQRPLNGIDDRAEVLRSLACVDDVLVFEEDTPCAALEKLRPDLWVKAADYASGPLPEATTLAGWGGQAVVVPLLQNRSTTRLVQEVLRREAS